MNTVRDQTGIFSEGENPRQYIQLKPTALPTKRSTCLLAFSTEYLLCSSPMYMHLTVSQKKKKKKSIVEPASASLFSMFSFLCKGLVVVTDFMCQKVGEH